MAVILNADNGVVSGISGLTTTADNSGVLQFQSSGTATLEISTTGNINIPGTGKRITGDFSNATISNRVAFQASTANTSTSIIALPNGTGVRSDIYAFNNSDPTNASFISMQMRGSAAIGVIESGITGTGTYLPLTMFTGGSERLRIDTSGNVGIGTSSPYSLSNYNSLTVGGAVGGGLTMYRFGSTNVGYVGGNNANEIFITNLLSNGIVTFATNSTERVRIDSSGNVGIGVTPSPWVSGETALQVGSLASLTSRSVGSGNRQVSIYNNAYISSGDTPRYLISDAASFYRQNAGMHFWFNAPSGTAGNAITFTQAMTLNANGALALQGASTSANGVGITFPATQSASSDPNTLDDYEEGTWTPTISFGGATTGITYSSQIGTYTKIGNIVRAFASVQITNKGSATGFLAMGTLPFSSSDAGQPVSLLVGQWSGVTSGLQTYVGGSVVYFELVQTGTQTPVTHSNINNTSAIYVSFTYRTTT